MVAVVVGGGGGGGWGGGRYFKHAASVLLQDLSHDHAEKQQADLERTEPLEGHRRKKV